MKSFTLVVAVLFALTGLAQQPNHHVQAALDAGVIEATADIALLNAFTTSGWKYHTEQKEGLVGQQAKALRHAVTGKRLKSIDPNDFNPLMYGIFPHTKDFQQFDLPDGTVLRVYSEQYIMRKDPAYKSKQR